MVSETGSVDHYHKSSVTGGGLMGWLAGLFETKRLALTFSFFLSVFIASALAQNELQEPPSDLYGEQARVRHALVIGVADYPKKNGISKLTSPVYDAQELKKKLELGGIGFIVNIQTNSDVSNKEKFFSALDKFLERVRPGDEVLFYFSGHGYSEQAAGNFFLLPSAKSERTYLRTLPKSELRALKTKTQRHAKYTEWLKTVAVSEQEIEERIYAKANPETLIIIADACRNLLANRKGVEEITGIALPQENTHGTFRLYSASLGQLSLDSRETIATPKRSKSAPRKKGKRRKGRKKRKNRSKVTTSLFTSILLSELAKPRQEINQMFSTVKIQVRAQARKQGGFQVPEFRDSIDATDFHFWRGRSNVDFEARCKTAEAELAQLQYGVSSGSIPAYYLESQKIALAPCGVGFADRVEKLIRLQKQGAGALSTKRVFAPAASPGLSTPDVLCDHYAASPLDGNRPEHVSGVEINQIAIRGLAGGVEREKAIKEIRQTIEYCSDAVKERRRVARFKYNLARAYYALSSLVDGNDRIDALKEAAANNQAAVDLGYAAAYNSLALLHQKGEFYTTDKNGKVRLRSNRSKARELLKRGADRGHILAHYNLGLAYKNGDLGLANKTLILGKKAGMAAAFQHFSKAAEGGFVPAIIETARAFRKGVGIDRNIDRSISMLTLAASRGSWEAMYLLGEIYYNDTITVVDLNQSIQAWLKEYRQAKRTDKYQAIIWYARAAEAGDIRSQAKMADMLSSGEGLPAPQRQTSGRYWRLAADGGDKRAQMMLADMLAGGKIPFRPKLDGPPDAGAQEIKDLYSAAFARGNPQAGLKLARLYRTGFPRQTGSNAIPVSAEMTLKLLRETIQQIRSAAPHSDAANPKYEILAAHVLIDMQDKNEAVHSDGTPILTEDEINNFRREYGDPGETVYIRTSVIHSRKGGGIVCKGAEDLWVLVWNWDKDEPPTTSQFDWYERKNSCRDRELEKKWKIYKEANEKKKKKLGKPKLKAGTWGVTKKVRNVVAKVYKTYKNKKNKESFPELMRRKVSRK